MANQNTSKVLDVHPVSNGRVKTAARRTKKATKPADAIYLASLFPREMRPLPKGLSKTLLDLERVLAKPVWLLLQDDETLSLLDRDVWNIFSMGENELKENETVALVIDSPGGYAKPAYQIARLLKQKCGNFVAVVPRYAKSAATLLVLGAEEIYMGRHAELGPLDAQTYDPEREEYSSALDTVHALERLRAFALESVDEAMMLVVARTQKKTQTVLPEVLDFVAEMMRPLLEEVDVIEYTQMSRVLKVAEEYARRLLLLRDEDPDEARRIARHLVEHYPEHAFFIGPEEALGVGLPVKENNDELDDVLDKLYHYLQRQHVCAIGKFKEMKPDENQKQENNSKKN